MNQDVSQNKMGVMPINKLLISMSLPMMASMLVQALYNIVDSIFVAQLSEDALTAVSVSFPVQNLMIAVGVGIGVGVNALLSKSLGEGNHRKARNIALNGIFITAIVYLVFLAVGLLGMDLFFNMQAEDPVIRQLGKEYLSIVCTFSFGMFTQLVFERLLQATGRTTLSMTSQITGALINIVLDPLLIFGIPAIGLPAMGVAGAAWATVIGQIIGGCLAIWLNVKKNKELSFDFRGFRPQAKTCGSILYIGIPSAIMGAIGSVMTFGMNKILFSFENIGKTATAVFGVYFKLQSFVFMPIFGLNGGMVPIIAFNFGAKSKERIMQTYRYSVLYATSIMLVGLAIFQILPEVLLGFFDASAQMLELGVPALRTISLSFVFAGFCIITSSMFQALGNGVFSMLMSFVRQIIVLLPSAFLLGRFVGLNAVWFSFPIAEVVCVVMVSLMLRRTYQKVIKPLGQE